MFFNTSVRDKLIVDLKNDTPILSSVLDNTLNIVKVFFLRNLNNNSVIIHFVLCDSF